MSEESSGKKFDQGKASMSLIPADALMEVGRVFEFGKQKYDANNWRKGIKYERLLSAADRHLKKYCSHLHSDMDDESSINHVAHAIANLLMVLQFDLEKRNDLDDRYKG
jgi:hypothetical protein